MTSKYVDNGTVIISKFGVVEFKFAINFLFNSMKNYTLFIKHNDTVRVSHILPNKWLQILCLSVEVCFYG